MLLQAKPNSALQAKPNSALQAKPNTCRKSFSCSTLCMARRVACSMGCHVRAAAAIMAVFVLGVRYTEYSEGYEAFLGIGLGV